MNVLYKCIHMALFLKIWKNPKKINCCKSEGNMIKNIILEDNDEKSSKQLEIKRKITI